MLADGIYLWENPMRDADQYFMRVTYLQIKPWLQYIVQVFSALVT